jgi:hypothetical protein
MKRKPISMNRNWARKRCWPSALFSGEVSVQSRFGGIVTSEGAIGPYKHASQADERENGYDV